MVNLDAIKINVLKLKEELPHLNIDSIFVEQDGKVDKIFYSDENLHELRSCAKYIFLVSEENAYAMYSSVNPGFNILLSPIYMRKNSNIKSNEKNYVKTFKKHDFSDIHI